MLAALGADFGINLLSEAFQLKAIDCGCFMMLDPLVVDGFMHRDLGMGHADRFSFWGALHLNRKVE